MKPESTIDSKTKEILKVKLVYIAFQKVKVANPIVEMDGEIFLLSSFSLIWYGNETYYLSLANFVLIWELVKKGVAGREGGCIYVI